MSKEIELHENVREDIRIELLCEDVIALSEHLRLKEEECKQLQQDKAELVELLKALSGHTCPDDYCTAEEVEAFLKIDEMLEKHKCD